MKKSTHFWVFFARLVDWLAGMLIGLAVTRLHILTLFLHDFQNI